MTKDVLIKIKGMQFLGMDDDWDDPIEIMTGGSYYVRNGICYIKYEEVLEGFKDPVSNLIKIRPNRLEVHKRGPINVNMVFEENKKNITYYDTAFGKIKMGMFTTNLKIEEEEDQLIVRIEYTLDMNEEYVADCTLDMKVLSKKKNN